MAAFQIDLQRVSWQDVLEENNAGRAYNIFIEKFLIVYKKHFTVKQNKPKSCQKPWITRELLKKIKKREKLYARFIKTRQIADLKEFKVYRNSLNKEIRKTRDNYYPTIFFIV